MVDMLLQTRLLYERHLVQLEDKIRNENRYVLPEVSSLQNYLVHYQSLEYQLWSI
ncbi:unnamed protein product [Schistosoma margrebowiei]|uniref:Uncharacterized protein n=1 Tax=Schistosoma margrebowiei TaxID=48269 RepID=A0A3P8H063_9TREM|nr:unnamed protein product [Schistosoma margrebowiei]